MTATSSQSSDAPGGDNTYYRVSEVSNLFGIGPDSLYHYEELGLVVPRRNPENNYREYSAKNIFELNLLRDLMALELPLKDINRFLQDRSRDDSVDFLVQSLNSVNDELAVLMQRKALVETRIMTYQRAIIASQHESISIVSFPQRGCLLVCDGPCEAGRVDYLIAKRLSSQEHHMRTLGICDCYTLSLEEDPAHRGYCAIRNVFLHAEGASYVPDFSLPAGRYLDVCYQGPSTRTIEMLGRLLEFADEHNVKPTSNLIELRIVDEYESSNPEEYITELQLQVS